MLVRRVRCNELGAAVSMWREANVARWAPYGPERPARVHDNLTAPDGLPADLGGGELGADPNQRGTFGGPSHGQGVTAIQLAAQSGQRDAVVALLGAGADPLITDDLHGGTALGWARVGGHEELADILP